MIGLLLNKTGTVYIRATTGNKDYTDPVKTDLACGLLHLNQQAGPTSSDRAELSAARRLVFDASYQMPEGAQIVIDGNRWQLQRRTIESMPSPTGGTHHKRAYVQRVDA